MSKAWPIAPIRAAYRGLFDGPHATPKPSDEGPVFLGIGNITEDGHLDLAQTKRISEDEFPRWTKRVLPQPGDIVFTYEATLNRYAIVPNGFRGCLGRRLALIRPNPAAVNTRWLHYYFFGPEWRAVVAANTLSGATVERIPLSSFPDFPIRLPDLQTQRRIASILSAYDDLIENNTRRIAILEEMARRIYEEWFVRFRFPGHEQVKMVESELGLIPEGWKVVAASDAITINPKVRVPKEGLKPFVPMGSLSENSMLIAGIEEREGNSGSKFQNGDTLFARITPCLENGKTGFVQFLPSHDAVAFGSTEFIVLRSRTLCPEYVYALARSDEFRANAIKSMSGATGRQRVKEACFDAFLLAQPDAETLQRYREIVQPMFALIRKLAAKNANLRATRDLLLPKLISGELDVSTLSEPEAA
ncbi:MAG: restriction endonuclease subunit S [Rhizobium sp.]|nr:restriction endonuclease subunit S [Rhizobium sp.]